MDADEGADGGCTGSVLSQSGTSSVKATPDLVERARVPCYFSCKETILTLDESNPFAPPAAFGPFRVLHQIGIGVLGPVFRAYQPELDRLAAVKVFRLDITPEQAAAVARELEAVIALDLRHPGIVRALGAGVEGSLPYLAEEYVAAESFDVALRHYAPATFDQALPFVQQLAGAIDAAADAGIAHGTFHPRDIFVTPDQARATGFGIAHALEEIGVRAPIRRPYSAPERIAGAPLTVAADVFALAAITYELLTARRVAGTGEQIAAVLAELDRQVDGERIKRVFGKALAEDPARRYATARGFGNALQAVLEGRVEEEEDPAHTASRSRKKPRRSREERPLFTPVAAPSPPAGHDEMAAKPIETSAEPSTDHELLDTTRAPVKPAGGADWDQRDLVRLTPRDPLALDSEPVHEGPGRDAIESFTLPPLERSEPPGHQGDSIPPLDFDELSRDIAAAAAEDEAIIEAAEKVSFAPLDFETTRERRDARRTPPIEPEYEETSDADETPIVTPEGGTSWRLSLVAFFVTLALGVTIGLIWGYNLGARKAAADLAASAGGPLNSTESPVSEPTSGAGQAILPPSTPPVGVSKTTGRMLVRSTPEGAQVTIDGEARGETPLDLHNMPFREYNVRVSREGYTAVNRRITLSARHPVDSETVKLEPEATARATPPPPLTRPKAPAQAKTSTVTKPPEAIPSEQSKVSRPTTPSPQNKALAPVPALPGEPAPTPPTPPAPVDRPAPAVDGAFGSVYFASRPAGATVFVDGRSVGTTPVRVPSLTPGSHRVRFERNGYQPWATTFIVVSGGEIRVTGSLERR